MSEGRAHPEEVGREHATECVWIVSRCLSVISSCVLPRAGRATSLRQPLRWADVILQPAALAARHRINIYVYK